MYPTFRPSALSYLVIVPIRKWDLTSINSHLGEPAAGIPGGHTASRLPALLKTLVISVKTVLRKTRGYCWCSCTTVFSLT